MRPLKYSELALYTFLRLDHRMGLNDRSYVRRPPWQSGSSGFFSDMPPVCRAILIANIVVFLLQIFITRPTTMDDLNNQMTDYYLDEYAYDDEFFDETTSQSFEDSDASSTDASATDTVESHQKSDQESIDRKQDLAKAKQQQMRDMLRYMPRSSVVQDWCELDPEKVRQGQIWRLVTSAFCHDRMSIFHSLFNMLFLYWFGRRLEWMYGSKEFCLFYFASAIVASCAFLFLQWYTNDLTPAIGASGAIWGVMVLYAIHHPYETINIYFLFPVQIRWLVLLYLVFDLHPVLLALNHQGGFSDGTAHAAHLGGAAFGYLYFRFGWRLEPFWNSLPIVGRQGPWQMQTAQKPRRRSLKIARPDVEKSVESPPDHELDRVLDKIHSHGRASLSDDEVEILEKASRRYRDN